MIDLLFASVLLLMAAAIVVLFAMLGELATRISNPARLERTSAFKPIDGARIGHVASWWPPQLSYLNEANDGVLLVLSSACASCEGIAQQLKRGADLPAKELGLLVSCGSKESGRDFIARHQLDESRLYIDQGGEWVRGEFNVMMSPAALVLNRGRLETALVFDDLKVLSHVGNDLNLPAGAPRSSMV